MSTMPVTVRRGATDAPRGPMMMHALATGVPWRPRQRGWAKATTVGVLAAMMGLAGIGAGAQAAPSTLTLDDAVRLALAGNPRLLAARDRLDASREGVTAGHRRLLPAVRLNDELQRYNSPFDITFAFPGAPAQLFRARDQTTNSFVASTAYPLVGAFRQSAEIGAQAESAAADGARIAAMEADVREAVQTDYLRTFEARAMQTIADTSARELSEEVTVAKARLASGVITRADLLRLEVAVANARQQAIQAESQATVSYAALIAEVGISATDGAVTLVEPTALLDLSHAASPSLERLLPGARQRRPELAAQEHLTLGADRHARAQGLALLPEISLEAAYQRIDGQVFVPKNSGYVGVRADWAIWEWGATEHERRAALAQAAATRRDGEVLERRIEVELQNSLAAGVAAHGAVEAAQEAIASAEEAFRVTEAQTKSGTATTTDLLESESALTQARLNLVRARYEEALARVTLARASGE